MTMQLKKLVLLIIIASSIASCKKEFLDLDPVNSYTYYNFPKNEGQAEQAVVACYRQMVPIYNSYMWLWGDMLSDNASFRFNQSDRGGLETERLDEFIGNSSEGTIANTYKDCFEGVLRSNYVLESLPTIAYNSDSIKNIREGEALFFRAFHYFNMVRLFGDVPIVTKVVTEPNENTAIDYPRKPVQQVYDNLIIPNTITAIAKLPATVPATQKGRLTKAAAQMLLAKVYMTLNRFGDALPLYNSITGFSLHPLYVSNFNPLTKNGVESIFEIQVNPIPSSAGGFSFGFMSQWAPWGTGNTFWPVSNSRGGLNQPTNDLNNAYETGDLRKAVTIASSGTGPATILCFKKFAYPSVANAGINEVQWPVYRFADVLLGQAECLNEVGFPSTAAFTALNLVRTRAGLPAKTQGNANPLLAVNSQADFRLAIEQERRVEFAGEAHRWFDLLRTNRAVAVMTTHGAAEKLLKPTTITDPSAYTNIKTLIAIPFREIQQFGYPQNPGW
jgi:starch-binding outer membrane protein, SusD/RagB family